MQQVKERGLPCDPSDVVYYVRCDTIVARADHKGLPRIVEAIFAFMYRNAAPISEYFYVPKNKGGGNRGAHLGTANKAAANRYLVATKEGLQMTLPLCLGIIDALALVDAVFSQEIFRSQISQLATGLGYLARCSRETI